MIFRLNLAPAPMLDFLGAQAFRAASAGVRLGVFDVLDGPPLTADQIAERIGADRRGTALLLDALHALGYLTKGPGGYARSAATAKWLPLLAEGLPFLHSVVFDYWDSLEDTIRRGAPARAAYERFTERPDALAEFQAGMKAIARMTAAQVVAKVKLPPAARQLIDVGGGHGLYSIAFCRRHMQLSATIFDLAPALAIARSSVAGADLNGRITVQEGDFWTDALGAGYDVALVFNIVHSHQPEQNVELLRRTARALNPGGLIVILDQFADAHPRGPTARAVARLNGLNLFNASGGQCYSGAEISAWLARAGFGPPRRIDLLTSPGNGLLIASTSEQHAA